MTVAKGVLTCNLIILGSFKLTQGDVFVKSFQEHTSILEDSTYNNMTPLLMHSKAEAIECNFFAKNNFFDLTSTDLIKNGEKW